MYSETDMKIRNSVLTFLSALFIMAVPQAIHGQNPLEIPIKTVCDSVVRPGIPAHEAQKVSPYHLPYSVTERHPDWHRMWINTAVLSGAFAGTLLVLECLPEDATSWNRAELQDVPLFKRWHDHVIKKGPEWDHDKFYFNYILHPYAGAVYYMGARSCGFNAWQSLLYCSCVSTIGWEFGIEAFMERPSIQDIFITPLVGSLIGEGFYKVKRRIVGNGYRLAGSRFLGNFVAFLVDPVNETVGLFAGNPCRRQERAAKSGFSVATAPVFTTGTGIKAGFNMHVTF